MFFSKEKGLCIDIRLQRKRGALKRDLLLLEEGKIFGSSHYGGMVSQVGDVVNFEKACRKNKNSSSG
jgi:hypothetical protein